MCMRSSVVSSFGCIGKCEHMSQETMWYRRRKGWNVPIIPPYIIMTTLVALLRLNTFYLYRIDKPLKIKKTYVLVS